MKLLMLHESLESKNVSNSSDLAERLDNCDNAELATNPVLKGNLRSKI